MTHAISDTLNKVKAQRSLFTTFFCPSSPIFFILVPYATLQSASTEGQHIQLCGESVSALSQLCKVTIPKELSTKSLALQCVDSKEVQY